MTTRIASKIAFALVALLMLAAAPLRAETRLLMIEQDYCEWCEKWNEEVGVIYAKTAEGKRAPLRRTDIFDDTPADVTLKTSAQFTPTFVLLIDGAEFARIEGYPGEDFFWAMLNQILDKADRQVVADGGS